MATAHGTGRQRLPRPPPLTTRIRVKAALLVNGLFCTGLGALLLMQPIPSNFDADWSQALGGPNARGAMHPLDFLTPPSLVLPQPHPDCRLADDELRSGRIPAALKRYRELAQRCPEDSYAAAMATCLHLELGHWEEAAKLASPLRSKRRGMRSLRMLEILTDECRKPDFDRNLARAWMRTLNRCANDSAFLRLHPMDRLADVIDQRLYRSPREGRSSRLNFELNSVLALLEKQPDETLARKLLNQGTELLPLQLLAAMVLQGSAQAENRALAREALVALAAVEPDNAYFLHLLGAHDSPGLFPPLRAMELASEFPEYESLQFWKEARRRSDFDSHAQEIYQLALRARRVRGDSFPALSIPAPRSLVFFGHPNYVDRLVYSATICRGDVRTFETMAGAALDLLDQPSKLEVDPFLRPEDELRLHRERLFAAAREVGVGLSRIRRPPGQRETSPRLPASLRFLHRYVLRPPPIPSLVSDFRASYARTPRSVVEQMMLRPR